ncbi:MAG TPA: TIGR03067 domain-containing protein [Pirellulaceae bacterium]|nr:TIGR03067 domain-containing protein [Pirellulaceae bacterium]
MRHLVLIAAAGLLAGCSATAASNASPEDVPGIREDVSGAGDIDNWQGRWQLVSYTADGQTAQADIQWIVYADHYVIQGGDMTGQGSYPYVLDPSQKRIDVHHHDTPAATYGGHFKGIYELQGDSLAVCYDLAGQRYPNSLDASPGSRQVLYQFQRQSR